MPTYVFWLIPLLVWLVAVLAIESQLAAPTPSRERATGEARRSRRRQTAVARPAPELRSAVLSHYFFLPTVPEAWQEVRRTQGHGELSHPLIQQALDEVATTTSDGSWRVTYSEFAPAYERLRRERLASCIQACETLV